MSDRERDRDGRQDDRPEREVELAPFTPPPSVLAQPAAFQPADPSELVAGSALAHAEAAALAERLVTQLSLGRVGKNGHELRMRVALGRGDDLGVRLRLEGGALSAVLTPTAGGRADAVRIADVLRRELRARGVDVEAVTVD